MRDVVEFAVGGEAGLGEGFLRGGVVDGGAADDEGDDWIGQRFCGDEGDGLPADAAVDKLGFTNQEINVDRAGCNVIESGGVQLGSGGMLPLDESDRAAGGFDEGAAVSGGERGVEGAQSFGGIAPDCSHVVGGEPAGKERTVGGSQLAQTHALRRGHASAGAA